MSIFHTSQCLWHLVKSHTMDDRRNSVIQVFLDPSTSRSDVVKITIKWECCVICHVRKIKTFMSSQGQEPAAGSGYHTSMKMPCSFFKSLHDLWTLTQTS